MHQGGFFIKHNLNLSSKAAFKQDFSARTGFPFFELEWVDNDWRPEIPKDFTGWILEVDRISDTYLLSSDDDFVSLLLYSSEERDTLDALTIGSAYVHSSTEEWMAIMWAILDYWKKGCFPDSFVEARKEWLDYAKEYAAEECILFNIEKHQSLEERLLKGECFETVVKENEIPLNQYKLSDLLAHPIPEKELETMWYDVLIIDDLIAL